MKNIFLISTLVLLMACGGGGGDSSETDVTDDTVTGLTTPSNMSVVTAD